MKYRILHIIESLGHGGAEHQLVLNISTLNSARFENFVCYLRPAVDYLLRDVTQLGVHAFCLGVKGKGEWISGIWRLVRFIKSANIDLVHTSLFESEILGGIAGRLSGVPVVSSLVNTSDPSLILGEEPHPSRTKFQLARLLTKMVYMTCFQHFVAISQYVRDSAIQSFKIPETKVTVIPRAVPREWLESVPEYDICALRAELSLNGCYPVILNVGRLVSQKGQRYLLEAMPRILQSLPKAKLLIVGEGPLKNELEIMIRELHLQDAVLFLGKSTRVKELLLACDFFIFPSLWEGFGVTLLEAVALGKPCIACNVGPISEFIEHKKTGLLVKSRCSQSLADAVLRLSSDKEMVTNLGQRAQQTVLTKFLIDKNIKKLEALYTQIISSSTK